MKLKFALILSLIPILSFAQVNYNSYFKNKSLRFDFLLGGNSKDVIVYPKQMKEEPFWAGSQNHLIDPFNYGSYRFEVFDSKSDSLIFSKGFSTLFQEWQTTAEAKTSNKTFYQAAIFPYPKKEVELKIEARQWDGTFTTIYSTTINPKDYFILKEEGNKYDVTDILKNGKPEKKVDIVILAEGYSSFEKGKFIVDAKRVTGYLFDSEPFKSEKEQFNIKAVFSPSVESGTDVPGENIYKNTHFNSSFYTFDLPRYLTTSDMKTVYDVASQVPYDQVYVLVNTERYGGGGFYNFVTVCTADNELTPEVFVHEFGHGFAGLGDEYYSSAVAYEDFYNLDIEPWEPNITTLVDFDKKWKAMVDESTPVPTPRQNKYSKTIGVYEGGGYMSEGIYSPFIDCRMKSNEAEGFCPVCVESIRKVIQFYTE
ncbi:M64 family metallopeptidase [uncultured Draconibacterium sp.]|uniref:M64 family metallopeptidase n=1 Tax=uncultured Draconibacterium sp. TaxID=1573823 RepID=UPI003216FE8F